MVVSNPEFEFKNKDLYASIGEVSLFEFEFGFKFECGALWMNGKKNSHGSNFRVEVYIGIL